eukprot:2158435-Pyramimonas_sp.AAC.1
MVDCARRLRRYRIILQDGGSAIRSPRRLGGNIRARRDYDKYLSLAAIQRGQCLLWRGPR